MIKLWRVSTGALASHRYPVCVDVDTARITAAPKPLRRYVGRTEEQFRAIAREKAWAIEDITPERSRICDGCGKNYADPPGRLCPGCEAYQDHQR